MISRRSTFTLLLHSLSDDGQRRTLAMLSAIHEHAGRAWIFLDRPVIGMPARIIGVTR